MTAINTITLYFLKSSSSIIWDYSFFSKTGIKELALHTYQSVNLRQKFLTRNTQRLHY